MQVRDTAPLALAALALSLPSGCSGVRAPEAAHERHARAPDGLSLAYEELGTGAPALVFVHGWCGDRALWRTTLAAFAPRHRVLALDLGGHGTSGAERGAWSLEVLAGDVVAVCDAAAIEDAILVGHSMGAPVALLAAARLPGRVRGVIGVDSLHDVDFAYPPGFLAQVAAGLEADYAGALEASLRGVAGPGLTEARVDWLVARAARTDRGAAIGLLRGFGGFDLAAALGAAAVPVRVVNAAPRAGGLVTAVEHNRRAADFDALLLEDCGHFPMLEQPERLVAGLARWIDDLSDPPR
ncbi:MAG TPA: alpha/beta fold hydrolase [Planctomycetota bacterium]